MGLADRLTATAAPGSLQYAGSYAEADSGSAVRVLGLDASRQVLFELAYANNGACNTSWNTVPVPFEQLSFD